MEDWMRWLFIAGLVVLGILGHLVAASAGGSGAGRYVGGGWDSDDGGADGGGDCGGGE